MEHILYRGNISNEFDGVHYEDGEPRTTIVQKGEGIPHEPSREICTSLGNIITTTCVLDRMTACFRSKDVSNNYADMVASLKLLGTLLSREKDETSSVNESS